MAVSWDEYKNEVIALREEGLSSRDIASVLSKTNPEINPSHDRSIRNALQRWRDEGSIEIKKEPAKVLLFDIETAPLITYLWRRSQKYISDEYLIEDWYIISWSAKWLFEDGVISEVVTPEEARDRDDERIVGDLWELLNEADITITHNGDKFDIKMMNGRFAKYGMNLPMPFQSIDTYKAARRRLSLPSLGLDYIAKYFGIEQKHDTDFQLWVDCMHGKEKALKRMDKYCRHDVKMLEDVYLKLRPFITSHPNLGLFIKNNAKTCPACGSEDLNKEGSYTTNVNMYDAFRCGDCGSITRSRHSSVTKEEKEKITRSIAR